MSIDQLYERLAAAASLEGDDGAVRILATYEPAAGPGTKLSPPTYPGYSKEAVPKNPWDPYTPYVLEDRIAPDGRQYKSALLDSRQSQANRCEEALQAAIDDGSLDLPHMVLDVTTHGSAIRITSLTAPHRSRDAYLRDAVVADDRRFDATDEGTALQAGDVAAFYRHTPADLVYGVWDSHRQRRIQTKFPRFYTSEVVGEGAVNGVRMAGRYDLLTGATDIKGGDMDWSMADKGDKGTRRISEIGLGPIPPSRGPGGVTVQAVRREACLAFAGVAKLHLGDHAAGRAGRAVLAALALLGDRLAFGRAALSLRSGCDLVATGEQLTWVGRRGSEELDLSVTDARQLFEMAVERAAASGLTWSTEPIRLRPMDKLQVAIDRVFLTAPAEGE